MDRQAVLLLAALSATAPVAGYAAEGPSFDCAKAESTGEKAVCADPGLATLDRVLAGIYANASGAPAAPASLAAEQRGWIKGRDDCWKDAAPAACVGRAYVSRIAEIVTARPEAAGGAPVVGPIATTCEGIGAPMTAVFVNTDPGYLSLAWGDMALVLDQTRSGSGARFSDEDNGGHYVFWVKGREATFEGPALMAPARCVLAE